MAEPSLALGDILLMSWRGRCFNQRIIYTMTYRVTASGTPPGPFDYEAQMNEFMAEFTAAGPGARRTRYLDLLPPEYGLDEVRVQRVGPVPTKRSGFLQTLYALPVPGANANNATVANDAAALTFKSLAVGRFTRGTKHIGPVPDGASSAGLLSNPYRILLTQFGASMILPFTLPTSGAIVTPCIWAEVDRVGSLVDRFAIGDQSRVQRRRTVGLGE